jgi:hypothetical protein
LAMPPPAITPDRDRHGRCPVRCRLASSHAPLVSGRQCKRRGTPEPSTGHSAAPGQSAARDTLNPRNPGCALCCRTRRTIQARGKRRPGRKHRRPADLRYAGQTPVPCSAQQPTGSGITRLGEGGADDCVRRHRRPAQALAAADPGRPPSRHPGSPSKPPTAEASWSTCWTSRTSSRTRSTPAAARRSPRPG